MNKKENQISENKYLNEDKITELNKKLKNVLDTIDNLQRENEEEKELNENQISALSVQLNILKEENEGLKLEIKNLNIQIKEKEKNVDNSEIEKFHNLLEQTKKKIYYIKKKLKIFI